MANLRQTTRGARSISYADPANFQNTTNVRQEIRPKKAGSRTVQNARNVISKQRFVKLPQPEGCADLCNFDQEVLSANVTLSGSTTSKDEIIQLWNETKSHVDLMIADLSTGFLPDAISLPLAES